MKLQNITQVSKNYGISTRMLRYYEQVGLIKSLRKEDYAYRVYDETALNRLQQIIILRKLRIPVKHIISILSNQDAVKAVEIFRENINKIDSEMTTLSTIKSILLRFVEEINEKADVHLRLLTDEALVTVIGSLSFSDNQIKESKEQPTLEDLNNAHEELMRLEDKDVRIVYLPPMTMAAAYASGEDCVDKASAIINRFIKESGLLKIKPDARGFDFNFYLEGQAPGEKIHGHEAWVSVPPDMELPSPLIKREFKGGLFAAHVLREWDFQDWRRLKDWVDSSDKYESDWGSPRWEAPETGTGLGLEETLNLYHFIETHNAEMNWLQLDLLFPIKEKKPL
jgi:DNA-binding transcriptional MerR regulator